jgi:hypothetical protein
MLEITSRDTLDTTVVTGEFVEFIQDLNLAAAQGKQFVVATEVRDSETQPVALETRNITRIRVLDGIEDAFVGR